MSYSHPKRAFSTDHLKADRKPHATDELLASNRTPDVAIDAALRSVPLPDGLLTRLGLLVYTMPDELPDQFDLLGC